eukprot:jgi/Astpho2/3518/Aster-x0584
MTCASSCSVRPAAQRLSLRSAARPVVCRRSLKTTATANKEQQQPKVVLGATAAALMLAAAPAAQAANEGEPFIVQLGWAMTCAVFTFSLSLVVWGRSGL